MSNDVYSILSSLEKIETEIHDNIKNLNSAYSEDVIDNLQSAIAFVLEAEEKLLDAQETINKCKRTKK